MREPDVSIDLQAHLANREKRIDDDLLLVALNAGLTRVAVAGVIHTDASGKETVPFYTVEYGDEDGLEQALIFKKRALHLLKDGEKMRAARWSISLEKEESKWKEESK